MKYIVAVSGGVDSVVLLDMLAKRNAGSGAHSYIVAHVDHGIRSDSAEDEALVRSLAKRYDLPYETTRLQLGAKASEDTARQARYDWLDTIRKKHQAEAIITAHHQDDVIETMIINLLRGTGWRGLCSLRDRDTVKRPLLRLSRASIIEYAIAHELEWHEDSTNDDVRYLRNYVRYRYVQRLTSRQRRQWITLYESQTDLVRQIDVMSSRLAPACVSVEGTWYRHPIIMLDSAPSFEILTELLGQRLPQQSLWRIRHFICTAKSGKVYAEAGWKFRVNTREVFVSPPRLC